jgi:3,2-trans-enoyl-CoA isomerase
LPSSSELSAGTHALRRDPLFWILAVLCLLHLGFLAAHLVYPDLDLDYPFLAGDSHDWISNGLRLAGHDVRYTGRFPLLPLLIALLERLGALPWLPVVLATLFHGTVLAFYGMAARLEPRRAAFAVALSLLASHSLQGLALQVMADVPASCLLFLSVCAFLLAGDRPRLYAAAGLLGGLADLAQPAALFWAPAAAVTLLLARPRDLRSPFPYAGLVLFAAVPLLWKVVQLAMLGTEGILPARQWALLRFHAGSVPFYLWAFVSLLGLPACLLLIPGVAWTARRAAARSAPHLFTLALFAGLVVFFVFLYDFNAKRFLVYAAWPAGLMLAETLARLPRRIAPGAAGLLVIGSALPLPGTGSDPAWAGLWPLPPTYLHAGLRSSPSGSPILDPGESRIEAFSVSSLARFCQPCRVREARAAWEGRPRAPRPDPAVFAADRSALFLFERESDGGGRHRTLSRLSNVLRKPVKFLPADHFEPYWRLLEVSAVPSIPPDYAVYRVRLPGLSATWLAVAPGGSRFQRRLDALVVPPSGRSLPDSLRLIQAREKAEEILRFLAGSDAYLVMVPYRRRADLSQLYLPFLAETTELILSERGREREVLDVLAAAPLLAEKDFGDTRVRTIRLFGRESGVVSYLPESDPTLRTRDIHRRTGKPTGISFTRGDLRMIKTVDHGPVRELRLERPPANALSPELIAALGEAVSSAPDEGARALVLSGAPGTFFSGGLDVPHLLTLEREAIRETWRSFYALMRSLAASPVPVVAAITGHSPAGGAVLAIYCDLRVMAEGDFKIGLNEVPVGIPLPPVILAVLRRVVGDRQAERLAVSGELVSAAEALRLGLVDELAPPDEVVPRAVEHCRRLLALPPRAMAETRRNARAGLVRLFDEAGEEEIELVLRDWFSDETQATLRALVAKLAAKRKG